MNIRTVACWVIALAFGLSVNAHAAVTFYLDRATFDAANPGLPIEDFEEANISPGGVAGMTGPLDSTTNNALFSPGDILPGLSIVDFPGPSIDGLVVIGDGTLTGVSKAVGNNFFGDDIHVMLFSGGGVGAVGTDLASAFMPGDPLDDEIRAEAFGSGGSLGSATFTITGIGFIGASSDAELITRIELSSDFFEASLFVDNVAFGSSTTVPEPTTLGILGLGLALIGFRRRRST